MVGTDSLRLDWGWAGTAPPPSQGLPTQLDDPGVAELVTDPPGGHVGAIEEAGFASSRSGVNDLSGMIRYSCARAVRVNRLGSALYLHSVLVCC